MGGRKIGSIMIFVMVAMMAISSIIFCILPLVTSRNAFYEQARRSYGYFDGIGKLHGLVDIASESGANIALSFLRTLKLMESGGDLFYCVGYNGTRLSNFDSVFRAVLDSKEASAEDARLRGEFSVDDSVFINVPQDVLLIPIDDKIPFTEKFESELKLLMKMICAYVGRTHHVRISNENNLINAIIGLINQGNLQVNEMDHSTHKLAPVGSVDELHWRCLEQFNATFPASIRSTALNSFLKLMDESVVFSDDVRAVNFFQANSFVRRALCDCFCESHGRWIEKFNESIDNEANRSAFLRDADVGERNWKSMALEWLDNTLGRLGRLIVQLFQSRDDAQPSTQTESSRIEYLRHFLDRMKREGSKLKSEFTYDIGDRRISGAADLNLENADNINLLQFLHFCLSAERYPGMANSSAVSAEGVAVDKYYVQANGDRSFMDNTTKVLLGIINGGRFSSYSKVVSAIVRAHDRTVPQLESETAVTYVRD
jgi:hypothetical protein